MATLFCHLFMLSFLVLQWRRMRLHSHLACLCVLLLRSPHFLLGHPAASVAVGCLQEAEDNVCFVLIARAVEHDNVLRRHPCSCDRVHLGPTGSHSLPRHVGRQCYM